ncbi:MAG: hypothetical protein FWH05_01780 [Oscillospiraceae bacterium]|nr:hypothetical protein [Oscillospiraceae bacterium]
MPEQEITLKNTKAEILEALNKANKRAVAAEKGKLNPEKVEKEAIQKKAVETSKKAVEQNIFSKELIDKWNDLQTAISTEENRLQELYGVGNELQKLALIIEAGKERVAEIEGEKSAKEEDAKKALERLRGDYSLKNATLQSEYEEAAKKLKLERTREAEEFQYNLVRTREKENNSWADEKAARQAELSKQEEQAKQLLSEAESKADYIKELENKVAGIGELVESERKAFAESRMAELQRELDYKSALKENDFKNTVTRLEDKIGHLSGELETANKSVVMLQNKLDKAYAELRELATKTVESASGVKIIGNTDNK